MAGRVPQRVFLAVGLLLAAAGCTPRWVRGTPWMEVQGGERYLFAVGRSDGPNRAAAIEMAKARARLVLGDALLEHLRSTGVTLPPGGDSADVLMVGSEIVRVEVSGGTAYALARIRLGTTTAPPPPIPPPAPGPDVGPPAP